MKQIALLYSSSEDKSLYLLEKQSSPDLSIVHFDIHAEFDLKSIDLVLVVVRDIAMISLVTVVKERYALPVIVILHNPTIANIRQAIQSDADNLCINPCTEELAVKVEYHLKLLDANYKHPNTLLLNSQNKTVENNGSIIQFTPNEYSVIEILASNKTVVFSRERLYYRLYPSESDVLLRVITEYIYTIRQKFKILGIKPIKTICRIGYRWSCDLETVFI